MNSRQEVTAADGWMTAEDLNIAAFRCISSLGDGLAGDECGHFYTIDQLLEIADRAMGARNGKASNNKRPVAGSSKKAPGFLKRLMTRLGL